MKVKCQVKGHGCVSCWGRLPIVWDHFVKRADIISEQYPVQRALTLDLTLKVKWQVKDHGYTYKLLREASYRLGPFWYNSWCHIGTIFGTSSLTLNLTLKVKSQVKGNGCVTSSGRQAIVWDNFGTRTDVIAGRYKVPRSMTLNLTLEVKCLWRVMVV